MMKMFCLSLTLSLKFEGVLVRKERWANISEKVDASCALCCGARADGWYCTW